MTPADERRILDLARTAFALAVLLVLLFGVRAAVPRGRSVAGMVLNPWRSER